MASVISTDSLVLVTGINGYLGSHVADQLLQAGFRVRGTTCALSKCAPLKKFWDEKYGPDKVEPVVVEDMAIPGAFDEAVQGISRSPPPPFSPSLYISVYEASMLTNAGASGVAHVSSDMSFSSDPDKVIPGVLAGINSILTSASQSPTVQRFVYTSSATALTKVRPNEAFHISNTLWNEADIAEAQAPPPYEDAHAWPVYGASKALAEKELWKFVEEKKPHFVVNAILPDCNFGSILVKGMPSSTAGCVTALYKGDTKPLERLPPRRFPRSFFKKKEGEAMMFRKCF